MKNKTKKKNKLCELNPYTKSGQGKYDTSPAGVSLKQVQPSNVRSQYGLATLTE